MRRPMEAAASPLPRDETTPPVMKMYLVGTVQLLMRIAEARVRRRGHRPVYRRPDNVRAPAEPGSCGLFPGCGAARAPRGTRARRGSTKRTPGGIPGDRRTTRHDAATAA